MQSTLLSVPKGTGVSRKRADSLVIKNLSVLTEKDILCYVVNSSKTIRIAVKRRQEMREKIIELMKACRNVADQAIAEIAFKETEHLKDGRIAQPDFDLGNRYAEVLFKNCMNEGNVIGVGCEDRFDKMIEALKEDKN